MHEKTIARSHSVLMHVCMAEDFIQFKSKGQLTSAQDARFWQPGSSLLPGLRPDSDSSRDFGSRKVYPRENWAILKKKWAVHPKSTVRSYYSCRILSTDTAVSYTTAVRVCTILLILSIQKIFHYFMHMRVKTICGF